MNAIRPRLALLVVIAGCSSSTPAEPSPAPAPAPASETATVSPSPAAPASPPPAPAAPAGCGPATVAIRDLATGEPDRWRADFAPMIRCDGLVVAGVIGAEPEIYRKAALETVDADGQRSRYPLFDTADADGSTDDRAAWIQDVNAQVDHANWALHRQDWRRLERADATATATWKDGTLSIAVGGKTITRSATVADPRIQVDPHADCQTFSVHAESIWTDPVTGTVAVELADERGDNCGDDLSVWVTVPGGDAAKDAAAAPCIAIAGDTAGFGDQRIGTELRQSHLGPLVCTLRSDVHDDLDRPGQCWLVTAKGIEEHTAQYDVGGSRSELLTEAVDHAIGHRWHLPGGRTLVEEEGEMASIRLFDPSGAVSPLLDSDMQWPGYSVTGIGDEAAWVVDGEALRIHQLTADKVRTWKRKPPAPPRDCFDLATLTVGTKDDSAACVAWTAKWRDAYVGASAAALPGGHVMLLTGLLDLHELDAKGKELRTWTLPRCARTIL